VFVIKDSLDISVGLTMTWCLASQWKICLRQKGWSMETPWWPMPWSLLQ